MICDSGKRPRDSRSRNRQSAYGGDTAASPCRRPSRRAAGSPRPGCPSAPSSGRLSSSGRESGLGQGDRALDRWSARGRRRRARRAGSSPCRLRRCLVMRKAARRRSSHGIGQRPAEVRARALVLDLRPLVARRIDISSFKDSIPAKPNATMKTSASASSCGCCLAGPPTPAAPAEGRLFLPPDGGPGRHGLAPDHRDRRDDPRGPGERRRQGPAPRPRCDTREFDADVSQAKEEMELARSKLERAKSLSASKVLSKADLDTSARSTRSRWPTGRRPRPCGSTP